MGKWSVGVLLTAVGVHLTVAEEYEEDFESPGFPRPPLDGACLVPYTGAEKTLAAMVDTVVPGPDTDPDGAAGALEGCAMNILLDEYYPFKSYAGLICTVMDQISQDRFGKPFVDAPYEERLQVMVEAQEVLPVLRLAFRAIRSAFYGGTYNGIGLDYVGYPGPNLGYRHLKEATFRTAVCEEMSETGWLP